MAHKKHTNIRFKACDVFEKKFMLSEKQYALKAPVMEAVYSIHDKSNLKLYDCLVPRMAEYITTFQIVCKKCRERAKVAGIEKLPISVEQLEIQRDLQRSKVP